MFTTNNNNNNNTNRPEPKHLTKTKTGPKAGTGTRTLKRVSVIVVITLLVVILLPVVTALTLAGVGLTTGPAQVRAATNVLWSPPVRVLDYSGRDVALAQDPIEHIVSYAAASSGYGIVVGQESNNWLNGDHIKLATDVGENGQYPRSAYDEFSTLYVVWGARNATTGKFNIWFNRILRRANNVTIPRNLTAEMFGLNGPGSNEADMPVTGAPRIAYSFQQHKVFVVFIRNVGEGDNLDRRAYFSESGDQGTTWSKPIELGQMSGYAPANPNIIVDAQGFPHVYYGVMADNDSRSWIYERVRGASGGWSNPRDIVGAPRTREFEPRFTLAPNGDIWSSWFSDPATGLSAQKELTVARWNSASDQWQSFNKLGGEEGVGNNAIAVGDNGQVWVMWTRMIGEPDNWRTDFTYSTDNGQSWQPPMLVVFNAGWYMKRSFGMAAIASKGLIYFMLTAETNDPDHATGDALFLQQIPQDSRPSPSDPTPTPLITPPTSTPKPTIGATTPTSTPNLTPGGSLTPTATASGTATATATATATGQITTSPTAPATATPGVVPTTVTLSPGVTPPLSTPGRALPITTATSPTSAATPAPPGGFEVAPTPAPAQSQPGVGSGSGQSLPSPSPSPTIAPIPTPTSVPTPTLPEGVVSATAYAQAQASAAARPFLIPMPTIMGGEVNRGRESGTGTGTGGIGPLLEMPTATPTLTPLPTTSAAPTQAPTLTSVADTTTTTTNSQTATAAAVAGLYPQTPELTPPASPAASTGDDQGLGQPTSNSTSRKKNPPDPGPLYLLAIPGAILFGKGALNIGALLMKVFGKRAVRA